MARTKKVKIYEIDYLINNELSEEDLFHIFETPSLTYSLVIGMFKHSGSKLTEKEILKICKTDENWMYKHCWTQKQKDSYYSKVSDVVHNVYQYGEDQCNSWVDWLHNFVFALLAFGYLAYILQCLIYLLYVMLVMVVSIADIK
jgi:hypothetical protein